MDRFYKTRLAPTPSGYLHAGNALSFALTSSFARLTGASVLLRVDDMDIARVKPDYIDDIFNTLGFLGITWQEGPQDAGELSRLYSQTLRMPIYQAALQHLRESGEIFACTCSRSDLENGKGYPGFCRDKQIPLDTPGASWRLRTRADEIITLKNAVGDSLKRFLPESMTDFVVRKKDGAPAYQLSSVVDDVFFGVDLIIRGQDLIPSSFAQTVLARRLHYSGFLDAAFLFHPLIKSEEGKLSKSAGDTSIASMVKTGMTRADLYRVISEALQTKSPADSWEPLAELFPGTRL